MYYDINKTLSYNRLFNFVVGMRGVGKTYSAKMRVIKNYLERKKQFVYLRRYEKELMKSEVEKFFDDVRKEFQDHEFEVKHGTFYIDEEPAGFYMPLSRAAHYKSVPFPDVSMIIFDEFIIATGLIRYLPNEVVSFLEMYSTIARDRDVTCFFLSNAITFTNPYFLYFDLKPMRGKPVITRGELLLEVVESAQFTDHMENTRFGALVKDTDYGKYAMANDALLDKDVFLTKLPGGAMCVLCVKVEGRTLGVYRVSGTEIYYISEKYDKTCGRIIALDIDSHDVDTSMSKEKGALVWFEALKQAYYRAEVRFTSMNAKNIFCNNLRRL